MSKEFLKYVPLINAEGAAEFRVKRLKFGDGYDQRMEDGINIDLRTYHLSYAGDIKYIKEVVDFFTRHRGVKSFEWLAPDRDDIRFYLCAGFKQTFNNGKKRGIKVTIEEVLV